MNSNSITLKKKLKLYSVVGQTSSGKTVFECVPSEELSQVYQEFDFFDHTEAYNLMEEKSAVMKKGLTDRTLPAEELKKRRETYDQYVIQMTWHLDETVNKSL